ncbi:hypothetical protein [Aeromicrobium piscarium]|uniref:Uncharacterized protein n=1 Tax=Aeromicrobium piscarium TaxID=2590901 RepID=A0A554SP51_9ACTN|nr:hypothetical protein [Aeromicrobium piscarium]TSD68143.1 hypothetical protein FNM00_00665 [Aeromicrobium piscarium]
MTEPPSTSEVSRRLDRIEQLLKDLPNQAMVSEMLRSRDTLLTTVTDDLRDLTKALAEERVERMQADREERQSRHEAFAALERKAQVSRQIAIGAIGLGVTILLGVLGLVVPVISGGGA